MEQYNATERIGVNEVEKITIKQLQWIFREQPIVDMGIDAHIERVDEGTSSGRLIAVQIKTGKSHFHDRGDSLIYYGKLSHLDYWQNHSLPVVFIAHLPDTNETFWNVVSNKSATKTKKNWKLLIPKTNIFSAQMKESISELFEGSTYEQRLRKLSIDEPLMRHIKNGGKVSLELEDWVNKSLGRTPVEVFIYDEDGNETLAREWFVSYIGYDIKKVAETLFPWAKINIDQEFYDENCEFDEDPQDLLSRIIDQDNGIFYDSVPDDFIYPYCNSFGEIEAYRLQLTLNEIGLSYLTISEYLSGDSI